MRQSDDQNVKLKSHRHTARRTRSSPSSPATVGTLPARTSSLRRSASAAQSWRATPSSAGSKLSTRRSASSARASLGSSNASSTICSTVMPMPLGWLRTRRNQATSPEVKGIHTNGLQTRMNGGRGAGAEPSGDFGASGAAPSKALCAMPETTDIVATRREIRRRLHRPTKRPSRARPTPACCASWPRPTTATTRPSCPFRSRRGTHLETRCKGAAEDIERD